MLFSSVSKTGSVNPGVKSAMGSLGSLRPSDFAVLKGED